MKRLTSLAIFTILLSTILLSVLVVQPALAQEGSSNPSIDIETYVNGIDADEVPGPDIQWGTEITWSYVVTNIGDVPLTDLWIFEAYYYSEIASPTDPLAPGESLTFTGTDTAGLGSDAIWGFVYARFEGTWVSDDDKTWYTGVANPSIDIETFVNDEDADESPGPDIQYGTEITWKYVVTNTGDVPLTDLWVYDNYAGVIASPEAPLAPGESLTFTRTDTVEFGLRGIQGYATGFFEGTNYSDYDYCWYTGVANPSIDIETFVNDEDADESPGPDIQYGTEITWKYVITNTGDVPLTDLWIFEAYYYGDIARPTDPLAPGESLTFTSTETAELGSNVIWGFVYASFEGTNVSDDDKTWYSGSDEELEPGPEVGGDVYPVDRVVVLAPWLVLVVFLTTRIALVFRRRRNQS